MTELPPLILTHDTDGWERSLARLEAELAALCEREGIDLESLSERASRVLPAKLTAEPFPLTDAELGQLVADEFGPNL